MAKRATSSKNNRYKKFPHSSVSMSEILVQLGISLIIQIGYKCNTSTVSITKVRRKRLYLVLSVLSFIVSLWSVFDTDIKGLITTLLGATILVVECILAQDDLVDKDNDHVPISKLFRVRTPVGTRLTIYFFVAFFGGVCFLISRQRWLINATVFTIEGIDMLLSALVVIFDAEAAVS